jgi:hypothetical protein
MSTLDDGELPTAEPGAIPAEEPVPEAVALAEKPVPAQEIPAEETVAAQEVPAAPVALTEEAPVDLADLPTPPMGIPVQRRPRLSRRRILLSGLIVVLAVALIAGGYTVVRLLVDNSTYGHGHDAYQNGECAIAIERYDSVINGWRLVTLGSTVSRAQTEKAECQPFREAADRQRAGNLSGAIAGYMHFLNGRPQSPLTDVARRRVIDMFDKSEPAKLATVESCDTLPQLRDAQLLAAKAPGFYAACGSAYLNVANWASAVTTYSKLFADFGKDQVAIDTAAAIAASTTWCYELARVRADSVLSTYGELFPALLSNCAKASTTNLDEAIKDAEEFLRRFPGHRLTGEVTATYAGLINKQIRTDGIGKDFGGVEETGTIGGDKAVIMMYNDSPEIMRIALGGGPEPRVEEIAACSTCPLEAPNAPQKVCDRQATLQRIVIAPGEYDFADDFPKAAKPTRGGFGHWSLKAGKAYFACFSIREGS